MLENDCMELQQKSKGCQPWQVEVEMIFFLLPPFTILIFLRCYFDNRKKPLHSTFSKGLIWADEAASEQGPRAAVQRPGACVTQGVGALFHSWSQCFSQTLWWHLPREAEATCQHPGTVLPTWLLATSTNHEGGTTLPRKTCESDHLPPTRVLK